MIKRIVLIAALSASLSAFAGNDVPGNCGQGSGSGNACLPSGGAGGQGGAGGAGGNGMGVGIGVGVGLGVGVAHSDSSSSASASQGQIATGGTGYGGKADASATGGNASAAGGNGAGNSTAVHVGGDTVTYKAASAAAYSPDVPIQPRDCRIYIGFGAASRDGSGSGGIPIGNSAVCLSEVQITTMNRVNQVAPGTFAPSDFIAAACRIEGMETMGACQKK